MSKHICDICTHYRWFSPPRQTILHSARGDGGGGGRGVGFIIITQFAVVRRSDKNLVCTEGWVRGVGGGGEMRY